MSRLDYAPKLNEIKITDIKKGLGVFTPRPDKQVSFVALKATLKKAGYTLDSADIIITGMLVHDDKGWWIVTDSSGQHFALDGKDLDQMLSGVAAKTRVEITGDWKTAGEGNSAREVVTPREVTKIENTRKTAAISAVDELSIASAPAFKFERASFGAPTPATSIPAVKGVTKPLAPIRVTSPGLTVYKGDAVTPRLYFIKQHLGDLDVNRQLLDVSVSYTPTPRLQLEVELPFSRTEFDDGLTSGSGVGLGNITLWSKYRFFRTVKTYGD